MITFKQFIKEEVTRVYHKGEFIGTHYPAKSKKYGEGHRASYKERGESRHLKTAEDAHKWLVDRHTIGKNGFHVYKR